MAVLVCLLADGVVRGHVFRKYSGNRKPGEAPVPCLELKEAPASAYERSANCHRCPEFLNQRALRPFKWLKGSDMRHLDRAVSKYVSFECGEGWHPLIKDALAKIEALGILNLTVLQVKEKFGGLRIYLSFNNAETDAIIRAAALQASETCEGCGSKEKVELRGGGWLRTLCVQCKENRQKR